MKQYISLMMVAARSRLWQVVLITAGTCAVQIALFQRHLSGLSQENWSTSLSEGDFVFPLTVGLMLVCLSLASFGMEWGGSKLGYTLRRLPCGEERATLVFALHHFLCLLIFWGGQMGAAWFIATRYNDYLIQNGLGQVWPLILFYSNSALHGVLPVQDWPIYIRNVVMLATLAMAAATCSYHWRRGSKPFTVLPLSAFTGLSFPAATGMFGLPGPGSGLPATLPELLVNVNAQSITAGLFHLSLFLLVLGVVTYNLLRRVCYVDV